MPYQHYLDRTGKYGFGGRNNKYDKISTVSRGSFWPIFERTYHHYSNRRGVPAPYSARVAVMKRPEGHSHDHVGLGTLVHWRPPQKASKPSKAPGVPAGLVARSSVEGLRLKWVGSVDPVSCTDANSYIIQRATRREGPYRQSPPKSKNHPSLTEPSKMAISTIILSKLRTMPAEAILLRYSWPMRTCPVRGAPAMSVNQLSQGLRSITANSLLLKAKVTTSAGRVMSFTSPTHRFPVKER